MSPGDDELHAEMTDVAATLAELKAAVRRNAGKTRLDGQPKVSNTSQLTELADLAVISAHLPISWNTPVVGRAVALSKRATRILLRWYINPIVEQQNSFNEALVRVIASLEERLDQLEREPPARESGE